MSNATFPVLPGQTWPRIRTPRMPTTVKRANGRRYAMSDQLYPTYLYRINYGYLRTGDAETLAGFFLARGGAADTFLFNDRDDNTAIAQPVALGNGVQRTFQLVRTLGGYTEPVREISGAPELQVDGSATAITLAPAGQVTFATAPAPGAVITWSGQFLWRCAFTKSEMEFEEFMRALRTTRSVEFETDR
jgi:uncharacterized protein (TIGR02217 family)